MNERIRHILRWADSQRLVSAFTTRSFGSLSTRCETQEAVDRRFEMLARHVGIEPSRLFTLPQTHSNNVAILRDRSFLDRRGGRRGYRAAGNELHAGSICIDTADFDMEWQSGVDGVILAVEDIYAVVLTADCAPVMFVDRAGRAFGIAHIGLVGAINQLAVRMVDLLHQKLGIPPNELEIAILPSIRGCHYNLARSGVWQRLRRTIMVTYGEDNPYYRSGYFDLPGFIRWQLESKGIKPSRIFDLGICTVCQAQEFFSHVQAGLTGSQDREGRFGSVLGMRGGSSKKTGGGS